MKTTKQYTRYEAAVYTILMTISFIPRIGDFVIPQELPKYISIAIFLYTTIRFIRHRHKNNYTKKLLKLFLLYFIPAFILHAYSFILFFIGEINSGSINSNLSAYAPIFTAISSLYLFGKDALKYNSIAFISSWSISILFSFLEHGIGIVPFAIQQGFFNDSTPILGVSKNYFELSDIVLTVGLPLIYIIYSQHKLTRNSFLLIIAFLLVEILGVKRIAIAGLIASLLFIFLIKRLSDKFKKYLSFIARSALAIISTTYVSLIFNGGLYNLLGDVNLMGRNYYYDAIKQYGAFEPSYLGLGRNSVSLLFTHQLKYLKVGGVHSDILKIYMESGFVLFFLWLWYFLSFLPNRIKKLCDEKTMYLYVTLIIYTFILYLTDNVENYFIYQNFFIVIPFCYYLRHHTEAAS